MSKSKLEFVQRIEGQYVGDDCCQIMLSYHENGITVLNSDGVVFHYLPKSNFFVNKYISDERREQFPYSSIPIHKSKVKGKKVTQFNQLLDFNRIYIQISDKYIKELYAIKDDEEALLVTKFIEPHFERKVYMNHQQVEEFLKGADLGLYSLDGSTCQNLSIATDKDILEWYKEQMLDIRMREKQMEYRVSSDLTSYLNYNISKMTIDDLPPDLIVPLFDNLILVSKKDEYAKNNGSDIQNIEAVTIEYIAPDAYSVTIYNYPITLYNLAHIKQLEATNLISCKEPKFNRFLNGDISQKEIKEEKAKVKTYKKTHKKIR